MANTETKATTDDLAGLEAGLDALDAVEVRRSPVREILVEKALPPQGLQSLPSVAWVPPAVLWFGLNDAMMFTVILLGAVPSIANGLVSGIDQVPPLFLRAGRTLGATGLKGVRHVRTAATTSTCPASSSPSS